MLIKKNVAIDIITGNVIIKFLKIDNNLEIENSFMFADITFIKNPFPVEMFK